MYKYEPLRIVAENARIDAIAEHDASWALSEYIYKRDGKVCQYCGTRDPRIFVLEHVIPWSQGGHTAAYNLVVACGSCNNSKRSQVWVPDNIAVLAAENPDWAAQVEELAEKYPRGVFSVVLPADTAQMLRQLSLTRGWNINNIVNAAVLQLIGECLAWVWEEPPAPAVVLAETPAIAVPGEEAA